MNYYFLYKVTIFYTSCNDLYVPTRLPLQYGCSFLKSQKAKVSCLLLLQVVTFRPINSDPFLQEKEHFPPFCKPPGHVTDKRVLSYISGQYKTEKKRTKHM